MAARAIAATLSGMKNRRWLRGVWAAAVLGVVLTSAGWAQEAKKQSFHIHPVRPIAELRAEALKAQPPETDGPIAIPSLTDVSLMDKTIQLDIRYATANNFLGEPVYEQPKAYLQYRAAEALKRVAKVLKKQGYGLLIYDAYRPWYVTKIFWEATPEAQREFVADPAKGSMHNRGCAVDLTLYDLKTKQPVPMPSGYDEQTVRASSNYAGGTEEERKHREILRAAMEAEGFHQLANEWWHFDYKDWADYEVLNLPFDQIPPKNYVLPKIMTRVEPEYTEAARKANFNGTVVIKGFVTKDGRVEILQFLTPVQYGLEENVRKAIGQWKLAPATKDGKPIALKITVEVTFRRG